jgi:SPP1 family holin
MKISKWTIVRTIMTALVVVNLILKSFGISVINIDENSVAAFVEAAVEVAAIVCSWWYNNSFTEKAKRADLFFKSLKESQK